jgi:hypothetical protein
VAFRLRRNATEGVPYRSTTGGLEKGSSSHFAVKPPRGRPASAAVSMHRCRGLGPGLRSRRRASGTRTSQHGKWGMPRFEKVPAQRRAKSRGPWAAPSGRSAKKRQFTCFGFSSCPIMQVAYRRAYRSCGQVICLPRTLDLPPSIRDRHRSLYPDADGAAYAQKEGALPASAGSCLKTGNHGATSKARRSQLPVCSRSPKL